MPLMRPIAFCVVPALFLQSCENDPRVTALQTQVQDLNKKVKDLNEAVDHLKSENEVNKFLRDSEEVAYLTPGDAGYSTIKSKSDFGFLTVSLENVQAYANGSRVRLKFGNPTNATLLNVSATLDWGSVDAKGSPKNDEARSKTISFPERFGPGRWVTVDAVLDGVPPISLGFVRVRELTNKGISLYH